MEDLSQYLVPGSIGIGLAYGIIKLIDKFIDWLMQRTKLEGQEEKDFRSRIFADYDDWKNRVVALEEKLEERGQEYDNLQKEYLELFAENLRQKARIEDLEREVETLIKRIQQLEEELEYERQGEN